MSFFSSIALVLCFALATGTFAQAPTVAINGNQLAALLKENHIAPGSFDSSFSARVYNQFFSVLDPDKHLYTQQDLDRLAQYESTLFRDGGKRNDEFLMQVFELHQTRLAQYKTWLREALGSPLNFSVPDSIVLSKDAIGFATSERALNQHRLQGFKWEIIQAYAAEDSVFHQSRFENFASQHQRRLSETENRRIDKQLETSRKAAVEVAFLQAIATAHDPHTSYLSSDDLSAFHTSLSSVGMSFGFSLSQNASQELVITEIVPAGAAWNSNAIFGGDIITGMTSAAGEKIDLTRHTLEEVSELLNDPALEQVTLHLRTPGLEHKTVALVKQQSELSENTIKGFVVGTEPRIGYILLPGFYTQWEEGKGTGCANDVAKEILKLKKENIAGLVLDVRFNGGGSVREAAELAGLFIDAGPVAIASQKVGPPVLIRDPNKGVVYDGPLLVLVNGGSASASELLAATLQDYNRALVVGMSTYGKATAQSIYPLAEQTYVKITDSKIYRITGVSTQGRGVQPHIVLPDLSGYFPNEASAPYALFPDSIVKKTYYTPFPSLPVHTLREKSVARSGAHFNELTKMLKILEKPIPLNPFTYQNFLQQLKKLYQTSATVTVRSVAYDTQLLAVNQYKKGVNENLIAELSASAYVSEAYHILKDYINLRKP